MSTGSIRAAAELHAIGAHARGDHEEERRWLDLLILTERGTERVVPGTVPRQLRFTTFDKDYATPDNEPIVADLDKATCVTSEALDQDGMHYPVIDIDLPCTVVESTTPGHCHLYIDKAVSLGDYLDLLNIFYELGIVEGGYLEAARRRGYTAVRLPWVSKPQSKASEVSS